MKNIAILLITTIFFCTDIQGQTSGLHPNDQYALERVSIHRWNKFRPWWMFAFIFPKYKDGDKRMVPEQGYLLATTAVTEIHTRKEKQNFDTIAKRAEIKALDKVANLSWHLFYKAEVEKIDEKVQEVISEIANSGASPEEILLYQTFYALTKEGLYIVLDSFIKDAEKREAIIRYKALMENFLVDITTTKNIIESSLVEEDIEILKESLEDLRKLYSPENN